MERVLCKMFTEDRVELITTQGNWDAHDKNKEVQDITSDGKVF